MVMFTLGGAHGGDEGVRAKDISLDAYIAPTERLEIKL